LTKDGLRKRILEHEEKYHKPSAEDVETILHCVEGIGLLAELKRCYEEIDWLLVVEDHFTSDGSYNNNGNFVYECAVNEKYGYRIEVIGGAETVVHEFDDGVTGFRRSSHQ
jgi:hypothetical protein